MKKERQIVDFIPWKYNKVVAGGPESRFDFSKIVKFNYECWQSRVDRINHFESISINPDLLLELINIYHEYKRTGTVVLKGKSVEELMKKNFPFFNDKNEWFVRMSYRSPKDTIESRSPLKTLKETLITVCKSERCYDDMIAHYYHLQRKKIKLPELYIHFVPWMNCNQNDEFRCFVHKKKLVAISYQFPDSMEFSFRGEELCLVECLNSFVEELWKKHKNLYDDCIIDIEVEKDEEKNELTPKLIEFNAYGYDGSTSPVLFDWKKDEDLLYNEDGIVELRFSRCNYFRGIPFFKYKIENGKITQYTEN